MRISVLILICLSLFSCDGPKKNEQMSSAYFDLKGYFDQEVNRLSAMKTSVSKTVARGGNEETKQVQPEWRNELSLFAEADINKPAWKDSYRKVSTPDHLEFIALEDNLKTRKIEISRIGNQIKRIHIINQTSNFLYNSTEDLLYIPDSVYIIKKDQNVKILGTNHYLVTGRFK